MSQSSWMDKARDSRSKAVVRPIIVIDVSDDDDEGFLPSTPLSFYSPTLANINATQTSVKKVSPPMAPIVDKNLFGISNVPRDMPGSSRQRTQSRAQTPAHLSENTVSIQNQSSKNSFNAGETLLDSLSYSRTEMPSPKASAPLKPSLSIAAAKQSSSLLSTPTTPTDTFVSPLQPHKSPSPLTNENYSHGSLFSDINNGDRKTLGQELEMMKAKHKTDMENAFQEIANLKRMIEEHPHPPAQHAGPTSSKQPKIDVPQNSATLAPEDVMPPPSHPNPANSVSGNLVYSHYANGELLQQFSGGQNTPMPPNFACQPPQPICFSTTTNFQYQNSQLIPRQGPPTFSYPQVSSQQPSLQTHVSYHSLENEVAIILQKYYNINSQNANSAFTQMSEFEKQVLRRYSSLLIDNRLTGGAHPLLEMFISQEMQKRTVMSCVPIQQHQQPPQQICEQRQECPELLDRTDEISQHCQRPPTPAQNLIPVRFIHQIRQPQHPQLASFVPVQQHPQQQQYTNIPPNSNVDNSTGSYVPQGSPHSLSGSTLPIVSPRLPSKRLDTVHSPINSCQTAAVPCPVCDRHRIIETPKHGIACCRACARFFSESFPIRKKYKCKKNNNCLTVRPLQRIRCRKCRFTKCLAVGMTPPDPILGNGNNTDDVTAPAADPLLDIEENNGNLRQRFWFSLSDNFIENDASFKAGASRIFGK